MCKVCMGACVHVHVWMALHRNPLPIVAKAARTNSRANNDRVEVHAATMGCAWVLGKEKSDAKCTARTEWDNTRYCAAGDQRDFI